MAITRQNEIIEKAAASDASAVPRYNLRTPDGALIGENVALELANAVTQMGTPVNAAALNEMLAASGVTAGAASAYTLAQEGFALFDGAPVRFRLHAASGAGATLNVNGTGAKALKTVLGDAMPSAIPAGMWVDAKYSTVADAYILSGGSVSAAQIAAWDARQTAAQVKSAIESHSKVLVRQQLTSNSAALIVPLASGYTQYKLNAMLYAYNDKYDGSLFISAGGSWSDNTGMGYEYNATTDRFDVDKRAAYAELGSFEGLAKGTKSEYPIFVSGILTKMTNGYVIAHMQTLNAFMENITDAVIVTSTAINQFYLSDVNGYLKVASGSFVALEGIA